MTGRFSFIRLTAAALAAALLTRDAWAGSVKLSEEDLARQRTELVNLLGASEKTPSCEDWRKFDEKTTVAAISKAVQNEQEAAPVRVRAAFALGCYQNPQAGRALHAVLDNPKTTNLVRGPALVALADSQKGGAVPEIEKALKSNDPQFRLAAVDAAKKAGTKQAFDVLRAHLKAEKFPLIQAHIRQVLGSAGK